MIDSRNLDFVRRAFQGVTGTYNNTKSVQGRLPHAKGNGSAERKCQNIDDPGRISQGYGAL